MNLDELVTHYVAVRRVLGEKCMTIESILRAFCRAAGPQAPVAHIEAKTVSAFLDGRGPVTSGWFGRYRAQRILPLRDQSRASRRGSAAEGPTAIRPPCLHPRRDPPVAGGNPVSPGLPHPD
jgi:hypothetical protein